MGPGNSSADERKRRTIEYRNGIQSSTISYSNVVIPDGITNKSASATDFRPLEAAYQLRPYSFRIYFKRLVKKRKRKAYTEKTRLNRNLEGKW